MCAAEWWSIRHRLSYISKNCNGRVDHFMLPQNLPVSRYIEARVASLQEI
jgi:hypothetical protein